MYFFSQCREQIKYESMVKLGVPHPKYHVLLRQIVVSRETIFKIKCLFVRVLSFFFVFFSPIRSPINNFTLTFMKFAHHSLSF